MADREVSPERGSAPTTDLEAVTAALHEGEHVPSVVQSAPGGSSDEIRDFFRFDSLHDKFGLDLWPEPGEKHPWER